MNPMRMNELSILGQLHRHGFDFSFVHNKYLFSVPLQDILK